MDEQGYFRIVDRMKDMIAVGGFKVFPRNVEERIYEHKAVEECTVIGVPDDYHGEAVKAFVKLRTGMNATEKEIIDSIKGSLGKHELPREIEFRAQLPKTMIGKLSKKELVEEERKKYADKKKAKAGA